MSHDYWKFSFFVLILTNKNIKILMIEICWGLHLDNVLLLLLHLENKIYQTQHLCITLVFDFNAVWSHILPFTKELKLL